MALPTIISLFYYLLLGLREKYTGLDDVANPLYQNTYIFQFLPQAVFARKFMANGDGVFSAGSQHWKLIQRLYNFHFALVARQRST